jgi:hypothetical protein
MRTGYSLHGTRRLGNARIERLRRAHGERAICWSNPNSSLRTDKAATGGTFELRF